MPVIGAYIQGFVPKKSLISVCGKPFQSADKRCFSSISKLNFFPIVPQRSLCAYRGKKAQAPKEGFWSGSLQQNQIIFIRFYDFDGNDLCILKSVFYPDLAPADITYDKFT